LDNGDVVAIDHTETVVSVPENKEELDNVTVLRGE
jgi:hypothetical protein